jgi:hypothetical protein
MHSVRPLAAVVVTTLLAGLFAMLAPSSASAGEPVPVQSNPVVYDDCGDDVKQYSVPVGVDQVRVEMTGGEGGEGSAFIGSPTDAASGGLGGTVIATLAVEPGQVLTVEVGCAGGAATADPTEPVAGWGGEGAGTGGDGGLTQNPGGGGGGSTQIADQESGDVLLVAGGGGGGGSDVDDQTEGGAGGGPNLPGGDGGSISLAPDGCGGKGGTNDVAGAGGLGAPIGPNGQAATGADGGHGSGEGTPTGQSGGGGGGGYLAGGGGGGGVALLPCGGGGGGAGFALDDASVIDVGGGSGSNEGDGSVRIAHQTFTDVGFSHPFFWDIEWMAGHGISEGYQPGPTYKPSASVTRQAMSAFLYRFAGSPGFPLPPSPTFTDVSASHPFYDDIEWMAHADISEGYQPGPTYKPSASVTRQAMSAFLYRMVGEPEYPDPESPTFTDVSASNTFYEEIEWMAFAGISEGYQPGPTYKPSAAVSRQAMSAFLHRLYLLPS